MFDFQTAKTLYATFPFWYGLLSVPFCASLCLKQATVCKLEILPATQYDVCPVQTKINRRNKHSLSRTNIYNNKPEFILTYHR